VIIVKSALTDRLRLSLLQVMKLVVYCAVASACAAPMVHLWRAGLVEGGSYKGLVTVGLFEAVLVPLVWVGLTLILIRRGAWRDGLICALLICSVSVSLGIACRLLLDYTILAQRMGMGIDITTLALHVGTIAFLVAAAVFLSLRLWRGRREGGGRLTSHSSGSAAPAAEFGR
jgi:hypothetical protein